jgi:two-component system, LytTR family, sensor kinase
MDFSLFENIKEYYHKNRPIIWIVVISWLILSMFTSISTVLLIYLEARPRVDAEFYFLRGFLIWTLIAASTPIIIKLAKRFSPELQQLKNIFIHIFSSIVFIIFISILTALILNSLLPSYRFIFSHYFLQNLLWSGLAISISYWFIVAVVLLKNNYNLYIEKKQRSLILDAELKKTQLQLLREQLRPHFLFNALNSVNSLIFIDKKSASESLKKIRLYLNKAMFENDLPKINLEKELEFTQLYIDIEKERFSDRLKIEINIDKSAHGSLVPAMILQPLTENAIRHGIASHKGEGHVSIHAKSVKDKVHLIVENSGDGYEKLQMIRSDGIGIKNTVDRLEKLYDDNFKFCIEQSDLGGWRVSVTFPFEHKTNKSLSA